MIFSITNLAYMVSSHPLCTPKENRIEIFNEFTIYICCQIMTVFLNVAMPFSLRDILGWCLIGFAGFNILVNLALTMWESCKELWKDRKLKKYKKRAAKALH